MRYILYRITNLVNGKIYIGKHHCKNLDDSYFGSGTMLWRAFRKYGRENFVFELLYELQNPDELALLEECVVTQGFCERTDTYNLKVGGIGGGPLHHTEETKMKMAEAMKGNDNSRGRQLSVETKWKISEALKGRTFSEETKRKISEVKKGKQNEGSRKANEKRKIPIQAFKDGVLVGTFESQHEAARQLRCRQGNIYNVIIGRRTQTQGYTFKYAS